MEPQLTDEQKEALREQGTPVRIEDSETHKVYFLIDDAFHRRAVEALERRDTDRALKAGLKDLEAGRVLSFRDVDARIRRSLGLPARA